MAGTAKFASSAPRLVAAASAGLGLVLAASTVAGAPAGIAFVQAGLVAAAAGPVAALVLVLGSRTPGRAADAAATSRRAALHRVGWAALAWGGAAALAGRGGPGSAMAFVLGDLLAIAALAVFVLGFFRLAPPPSGARALLRNLLSAYIAAVALAVMAWTVVSSGAPAQLAVGSAPLGLALLKVFSGVFALAFLAPLVLTAAPRVRGAAALAAAVLAAVCVADLAGALSRAADAQAWGGLEHLLRAPALLMLAALPWLAGLGEATRPRTITGRGLYRVAPDLCALGAVCVAVLVVGIHTAHEAMRAQSVALVLFTASAALALAVRALVLLDDNAALAQSAADRQRHLHALAKHHGDIVAVVDARGRIVEVSPATADAYGYSTQDLLATGVGELVHPEDLPRLRSALPARGAGREASARVGARIRAADGTWRHIDATVSPLERRGRSRGLLVTARDISAQVALQDQVTHLTFHDATTGLPNRAYVEERVKELTTASCGGPEAVAVLVVHLDFAGAAEESAGRRLGDTLLVQVARRLRAAVGPEATVARSGEDEFLVLLEGPESAGRAAELAGGIKSALGGRPFTVAGQEVPVATSLGVAATGLPVRDGPGLLRGAEVAVLRVQARGEGGGVGWAGVHAPADGDAVRGSTGRGIAEAAEGNGYLRK